MAGGLSDKTLGVGASLLSPLFMVLGFYIWDSQWKASAFMLNFYKCSFAGVLFVIVSLTYIQLSPTRSIIADLEIKVMYLLLSSVLGILIGDICWLQGLIILGPRRIIAIDSLKPGLAGLLASFMLDEALSPAKWVGLSLSSLGVYLVCKSSTSLDTGTDTIGDKNDTKLVNIITVAAKDIEEEKDHSAGNVALVNVAPMATSEQPAEVKVKADDPTQILHGYIYAAANVFLDVFGSALTKKYGGSFTTFEINALRFGSAAVIMVAICVTMLCLSRFDSSESEHEKMVPATTESSFDKVDAAALVTTTAVEDVSLLIFPTASESLSLVEEAEKKDSSSAWYRIPVHTRKQWLLVTCGVLLVTFTCPALSNYALFKIPMGVSLTLTSVGPLYSMPLDWIVKRKVVHRVGVLGSIIAVAGVAILALV